jgi:hypothetical protein
MSKPNNYQKACIKELAPFVGRTVTDIAYEKDGGAVGLNFGDTTVWFLSDPEGNGPGFPSVEDNA